MSTTRNDGWQALRQLAAGDAPLPDLDHGQLRRLEVAGLTLDYTKARLDDRSVAALGELAGAAKLDGRFAAMVAGEPINHTEERAVLHASLRDPAAPAAVRAEMERMLAFANQVNKGDFKLPVGKPVKTIIHIGIGGSYLGPKLFYEAFPASIACRFVANIDPAAITDALAGLDPATTLVVSVSKSGTTTETLANTQVAFDWLAASVGAQNALRHLSVVSTNPDMGAKLNCPAAQSFVMWDWVGGRYSIWSPVSVSVAAACGVTAFREFLAGGYAMDQHVLATRGWDNMAVTLALLRTWHAMACEAQTHCVLAYQHRLRSLPVYLQQLVMESNGKSTNTAGKRPAVPTSAVWWGGEGTNDQHSYYQLLLQGMRPVPTDFILGLHAQPGEDAEMQRLLVANALGQSRAFMLGRDLATSERQLLDIGCTPDRATQLAPHLVVPGGQPSNLLYFQCLEPRILGALLAAYEHMTAALGWLWQINSFDQWGVELGKINFGQVLAAIQSGDPGTMDVATRRILEDLR